MSKVTPNTLTEKHVARLLERSKGDDLARYRRLATAMEAERDPIDTRCDRCDRSAGDAERDAKLGRFGRNTP